MSKRFLFTILSLLVIAVAAGIAVFLVKGYTFSTKEGAIVGTGIVSITSQPEGASVYIDGHLTTATNATIDHLSPKEYDVKIIKDGFIPWEKKVEVKEGLVSDLKITLFPAIPTLYPLTFNGVQNVQLSPDGQKLAFAVPVATVSGSLKQKGGIWVWTMTNQPISFARSAEPHQLVAATQSLDFTKAKLRFSPDSKELLVTMNEGDPTNERNLRNFILPVDSQTQSGDLRDSTATIAQTLATWDEDQKVKDNARVMAIRDIKYQQEASGSAILKWSPDETKYISSKDGKTNFKVVDLNNLKTEKSLEVKEYALPASKSYTWLPDSQHVILVQDGKIAVADFDGTNAQVIYAGTFEESSVYPWPDSSRLVFITSFPTPTANQPNLYGINLK
jgi:hypothetical protein